MGHGGRAGAGPGQMGGGVADHKSQQNDFLFLDIYLFLFFTNKFLLLTI